MEFTKTSGGYTAFASLRNASSRITGEASLSLETARISERSESGFEGISVAQAVDLVRDSLNRLLSASKGESIADSGELTSSGTASLPSRRGGQNRRPHGHKGQTTGGRQLGFSFNRGW